MATKVKIELNKAAVREQLLRSEKMKKICEQKAEEIQARLGPGYGVDTHTGKNRVNAMVYAETQEARRENARSNTILKAVR